MVRDEFDFGFAVDWMRKDLPDLHGRGCTKWLGIASNALVSQFYASLSHQGFGRNDTSSAYPPVKAVTRVKTIAKNPNGLLPGLSVLVVAPQPASRRQSKRGKLCD